MGTYPDGAIRSRSPGRKSGAARGESGMKHRISILAMAAALAGGIALSAPAAAQQFTMKLGTATPRGDQNIWMDRFKERVEARAGGRIAIRLFPASQLGTIPRTIEG